MRSVSASTSHGRVDEEAGSVSTTTADSNIMILSLLKKKFCSTALSSDFWRSCLSVESLATLILVIVCLPISVALTVFIFCSISMVGLAIMIFLVICLIPTRIIQLFRDDRGYEKLAEFKHLIRFWLYMIPGFSLFGLGMLYGIAKHVPHLKNVMLLDLPLSNLVKLVTIICGLCTLSSFVYFPVHQLAAFATSMGRHSLSAGQACSEIVDSLIFRWAANEVVKFYPSLKQQEILSLSTLKWIKVSVLVLIGYNLIILVTRFGAVLLENIFRRCPLLTDKNTIRRKLSKEYLRARYLAYYANGIAVSMSFMMSSMLLLLTWVFYFGKHLDIMNSSKVKSIWEYGKWTFVSLFILSFLWLIKTCVLLAWKANTIYDRLQARIISTCEQLYFLRILRDAIAPHRPENQMKGSSFSDNETARAPIKRKKPVSTTNFFVPFIEISKGGFRSPQEVKERLQKDLLFPENANPNLNQMEQGTQHFVLAKQDLLKEMYISDILEFFNKYGVNRELLEKLILGTGLNPAGASNTVESNAVEGEASIDDEQDISGVAKNSIVNSRRGCIEAKSNEIEQEKGSNSNRTPTGDPVEEANIENEQGQSVWNRFVKKLPKINQENSDEEFWLSEVQTWVERAHNQCMNLTNTLSSAKEVADCLNKIISWVLIGVIFIMWLLLTGLATTKVLVLIASPLLAATFIFGNTCKTLFEGILFVYVVHPIDVGDLCSIEDKLMEVKSIGVWITTFKTIDKFGTTQELVIYSNTELIQKTITNYKTKFDWSDQVEFNLCPTIKIKGKNQDNVITMIKEHLNKHECSSFLSRTPNMTISATDDNIKLLFRLEYKAENTEEWTYYECLQRKHKLRGDFHLIMQEFINGFKITLVCVQ